MDWMGVLQGAAVTAGCLGSALWLMRRARARSPRRQTRLAESFVRCVHGGHTVSQRRAVMISRTYDQQPIYICHMHRFQRKRMLATDRDTA
jgi:hypothetical protein